MYPSFPPEAVARAVEIPTTFVTYHVKTFMVNPAWASGLHNHSSKSYTTLSSARAQVSRYLFPGGYRPRLDVPPDSFEYGVLLHRLDAAGVRLIFAACPGEPSQVMPWRKDHDPSLPSFWKQVQGEALEQAQALTQERLREELEGGVLPWEG